MKTFLERQAQTVGLEEQNRHPAGSKKWAMWDSAQAHPPGLERGPESVPFQEVGVEMTDRPIEGTPGAQPQRGICWTLPFSSFPREHVPKTEVHKY